MLDIKTAKTRLYVGKFCHVPGSLGPGFWASSPQFLVLLLTITSFVALAKSSLRSLCCEKRPVLTYQPEAKWASTDVSNALCKFFQLLLWNQYCRQASGNPTNLCSLRPYFYPSKFSNPHFTRWRGWWGERSRQVLDTSPLPSLQLKAVSAVPQVADTLKWPK